MDTRKQFGRGLSDEFVTELRSGRFAPLLATSLNVGLDVQVRENYTSFYYNGLSVLALSGHFPCPHYRARIHRKYLGQVELPCALPPVGDYLRFDATVEFTEAYARQLSAILRNAQLYVGKEGEVEQRMIRANNCSGSSIILIDRQVQIHGIRKRADLVGLTAKSQFVIAEVKQGLDNRIQRLLGQICDYYAVLAGPDGCLRQDVAQSYRKVVEQKQSLGLLQNDTPPVNGQTPVTCLLVLYGYNPRSELLARLRQGSPAHSIPVDLVVLPEGSYALPPQADWKQLCSAQ